MNVFEFVGEVIKNENSIDGILHPVEVEGMVFKLQNQINKDKERIELSKSYGIDPSEIMEMNNYYISLRDSLKEEWGIR